MYNVIKFQSPFERLKLYQDTPDIALRKAIITQAIIDATNNTDNRVGKKLAQIAREWIFIENEDFATICLEAGLETSFVRKITKELMELHNAKKNGISKTLRW